ncbi:MAG: methyltransferase domain-containing protein [Proteobacteria bacterium]|nr:methyltransferase domain-containing protein [Pseudomonadota bacterium]
MKVPNLFKSLIKLILNKVTQGFIRIPLPAPLAANIEQSIQAIYLVMLGRRADPGGLEIYKRRLLNEGASLRNIVSEFLVSSEFSQNLDFRDQNLSIHLSRCQFVKIMPRAQRILDLGGSSQNDERGALIAMGYPYLFDELLIVELPATESHDLYRGNKSLDTLKTDQGIVKYSYHSMLDLSRYVDQSFDLVVNGQAIEHVDEANGDHMLREIFRVLKPGGFLAIDTPNGRVCRMQQKALINDDHKVEYSHAEMLKKLLRVGFVIETAVGLNFCGPLAEKGIFDIATMKRNYGLYHDIDHSYILAYLCRRPSPE